MSNSGALVQWGVYHDPYCTHTKPHKPKLVVAAHHSPTEVLGLLISSRVPEFMRRSAALSACVFHLEGNHYPFLDHSSYVDCKEAFPYRIGYLSDLRGTIHERDRSALASTILGCRAMKRNHKARILNQPL